MEKSKIDQNNWKAHSNKILKRLGIWAVAYVLSTALATFGPEFLWDSNQWLTIAAILVNLGAGVVMMVVFIHHLNSLDKMMQRIQLEAMGIALGVGVIGGLSYSLFDTENLILFDAEIPHLVILIGITYLIALLFVWRRFK